MGAARHGGFAAPVRFHQPAGGGSDALTGAGPFCELRHPSPPRRRAEFMDGRGPTEPADWSLSLVIPAYNEEAVIARAVAEADDALSRLTGVYEVLVVDDGSGDGTARAVAEAAGERPHVRLLRHDTNR